MSVRRQMQQGAMETYAIEDVAEKAGVSKSTVRRCWKLYNRLFPGDAIFPDECI